jgi:fluoride ion exporter CrcB/FEX
VAVLLSLIGAPLRWVLALRLNGLPGRWLPWGTLSANALGCSIDFVVYAVILGVQKREYKHGGSSGGTLFNGEAAELWGAALRLGLAGSLSTVSTWVAELATLARAIPDKLRAYTYAAGSVAGTAALGCAVYGWAVVG